MDYYRGMRQLTQDEAIAMAEGGEWKDWTPTERGIFQLYQDRLCMSFDEFHEGAEAVLGRPVWTHEFAERNILVDEMHLRIPKRSIEDSLNALVRLDNGQSIVVVVPEDGQEGKS